MRRSACRQRAACHEAEVTAARARDGGRGSVLVQERQYVGGGGRAGWDSHAQCALEALDIRGTWEYGPGAELIQKALAAFGGVDQ
jgi:hypothetical protein